MVWSQNLHQKGQKSDIVTILLDWLSHSTCFLTKTSVYKWHLEKEGKPDSEIEKLLEEWWKRKAKQKTKSVQIPVLEEDISEREDFEKLVQTLTDEEPEQLEVLQDLGLI